MKKLYIIPGHGNTGKEDPYRIIAKEAKQKDYKVILLNLQIKQGKLLSELVSIAAEKIGDDAEATIFGFSIGALISFCASGKISIQKAIICSISPYLSDDLNGLGPKLEKFVGKRLSEDMRGMRYEKSKAKKISIIYGEREHPLIKSRSKYIYMKAGRKGEMVIIEDTAHELTPEYTKAIIAEL